MVSNPMTSSTKVQDQRILLCLQAQTLVTLQASQDFDVMHPVARVQDLRQHGHYIETIRVNGLPSSGEVHRGGWYVFNRSVEPADGVKVNG